MKTVFLTAVLLLPCAVPADATDEITVRIGSGAVEIAKDGSEAERFRDTGTRGGGIVLVCKRIQLQRDETTYTVNCTDVKFVTAAGVEGIAPEARFDILNDRVLLTGRKGTPVTLIRDAEHQSDMSRITAEKVEMRLTPLRPFHVKTETNELKHPPQPAAKSVSSGRLPSPAP